LALDPDVLFFDENAMTRLDLSEFALEAFP